MDKVSFIIRTKNEAKDIRKTVSSIRDQEFTNNVLTEIVIIDNMSTDGTVALICNEVDKIIYISDDEFSWGGAINRGIEAATGDYIAIISGHCILENSKVILNVLELMKKNDLAVVYGMQIGDEKKDKFEYLELLEQYPNITYVEFDKEHKGVGISNSACILKKAVWEEVKFDETLISAEDAAWCSMVRKSGVKCAYSSYFKVIHGHYFNPEYIYRKWYWRTKIIDSHRNPYIIKMIGCRPFYMVKSFILFLKYFRIRRKLTCKVNIQSIFDYVRICEWPRYIARIDLKRSNELKEKYDDVGVPVKALKWGKRIAESEKYLSDTK